MEPETPANAVAELLNSMNKGQYLLLTAAIRQLGGSLRVDWTELTRQASGDLPSMVVDDTDGPVVLSFE